jgi:hypothetical protein
MLVGQCFIKEWLVSLSVCLTRRPFDARFKNIMSQPVIISLMLNTFELEYHTAKDYSAIHPSSPYFLKENSTYKNILDFHD